jgi:uncharacterized membrane protein
MKNSIFIILLALSLTTAFSSCSSSKPKSQAVESKATEQIVYTCTMHPEVRSDKPGKCPKCGMELIRMDNIHSDTVHKN